MANRRKFIGAAVAAAAVMFAAGAGAQEATTAARIYKYDVVIPLDGVNAKRNYEHEYAIHQMTILPASAETASTASAY